MSKNPMYRYLLKYVGTYRVLPLLDNGSKDFPKNDDGGIDESYDDIYIPCRKGIIKHSYEPYYLVWYSDKLKAGRSVKESFEKNDIPIYKYEETDEEVLIWFADADIKKVAKIVKPSTNGKRISPFSKRNLEKSKGGYSIPESELNLYSDIIKDLDKTQKLQFSRTIIKEFDDIIKKKKGKRYKLDEIRDESGLSNKEFIHYIGLWNDFIKFTKEKYEEKYD